MAKHAFKNPITTRPTDVEDGDAFAIKIVAIAGHANDWAAYIGPSDWTDERVAESGDKILDSQAEPLFYVLRASGRVYRR